MKNIWIKKNKIKKLKNTINLVLYYIDPQTNLIEHHQWSIVRWNEEEFQKHPHVKSDGRYLKWIVPQDDYPIAGLRLIDNKSNILIDQRLNIVSQAGLVIAVDLNSLHFSD